MIAVEAAAAGNSIVKVPLVPVLSPPNAIVQTAASVVMPVTVESSQIKQPLAVKEADDQETLEKSQIAVSESKTGVILVKAIPPAE